MQQEKRGEKLLKLFGLKILKFLMTEERDSPAEAITIADLRKALPEQERKAYSTTWRHIQRLLQNEYVACQLQDGISDLYFITQKGKDFCESQYHPY